MTSPTTIKAVTKPHVAGDSHAQGDHGRWDGHRDDQFKFKASAPTITSFTPATGTTSGTTTVTITGTNLYGATAVKFGTTTAKSFTVTSPTHDQGRHQDPRAGHSHPQGDHGRGDGHGGL